MTHPCPRILLIQTGKPPDEMRRVHGDVPVWFGKALDVPVEAIEAVRVFEGAPLPPPDASRVAIVTGSSFMVTDRAPWSEATAVWLREAMAVGMPLFGICYGHQLMAHALGGRVGYHRDGREMGSYTVRLAPAAATDALLADMPARFAAHLSHMQTVIEPPAGACILAASDHDPHQILRYGPTAISVQFHPEFTPAISRTVIRSREDLLRMEGKDPIAVLDAVVDAPEPLRLMRNFVTDALSGTTNTRVVQAAAA